MTQPIENTPPPNDERVRVGPYELIAQLAVGGMARVYLARHTADGGLGRLYAIKVILEHMSSDPDFIRMLLDEAHVASCLQHHNIVPVLQQGTHGEEHFIVMDYIEGCTLGALLKRHPNERPAEHIVSVMIDVLCGLQAAHSAVDAQGRPMQVIHRDISPANVLLDLHGLARIADFGIAKARDRLTVTQPGLYKGRFSYSAPERLMGDGNVDHRVDVFSVGAMMWEALTGEPLFRGASQRDTIDRVLNMRILPPSRGRLHPHPGFDAICLKALSRDPDERYSSAGEMARDLRRAAARHGFLPDTTEVGKWVSTTFQKEFAARRELIHNAAAEQDDTSYFHRHHLREGQLVARADNVQVPQALPHAVAIGAEEGEGSPTKVENRAPISERPSGFRVAAGRFDSRRIAPTDPTEPSLVAPPPRRWIDSRWAFWLLILAALAMFSLFGPLSVAGHSRSRSEMVDRVRDVAAPYIDDVVSALRGKEAD